MSSEQQHSFIGRSIFIFMARFFPSLSVMVVMYLFAHDLSKDQYGTYQNFWVQINVLGTVACLGIPALVLTYNPAQLTSLIRRTSAKWLSIFVCWVIAIANVFAILQTQKGIFFFVSLVLLFLFVMNILLEMLLVAYRRLTALSIISIAYSVLFVVLHVYWLKTDITENFTILFNLLCAIGLLRMLAMFIILVKCLRTHAGESASMAGASVRKLWFHLGLYDIVQQLSRWIDKLIIGFILSAELFAAYFNASVDIPFVMLIISAVGGAGLIQLSSSDTDDKAKESVFMMQQTGRVLSCVVFPLFFFLAFFRYEFFDVFFSNKYADAVPIFLMSILVIPVRALNFTTVLQHYHKGALINLGAIGELVLALLLMYPLYLLMGLPGIALSFVITTWMQAFFYLWHTARLLDTSVAALLPLKNWLLKLIIFFIVFIGIHYLLAAAFGERIVLFLGCAALVTAMGTSLFIEIKAGKHHDGEGRQGTT